MCCEAAQYRRALGSVLVGSVAAVVDHTTRGPDTAHSEGTRQMASHTEDEHYRSFISHWINSAIRHVSN